jgi:hypothetical protein
LRLARCSNHAPPLAPDPQETYGKAERGETLAAAMIGMFLAPDAAPKPSNEEMIDKTPFY